MRWLVALALLVGMPSPVLAHDMRPGVLSLTEVAPGDYTVRFVPPVDSRGDVSDVTLAVPPSCVVTRERLQCGELSLVGMRGSMRTVVLVVRADGSRDEWILDAANPRLALGATPPSGTLAWIGLGITHILAGLDHLAFVIGLLLVLQLAIDRRLLATITAFTIAHSITLALAVLGIVTVRSAPVEACIALSVVLVAREALHDQPTLLRRSPWLAAGAFGLIHGLGFASALAEIGLPRASLAHSLVAFNIGVEVGQLAVVAAVIAIVALGRRLVGERRVIGRHIHRATCYLLGAVAAWWLLERLVDLARGGG